MTDIYFIIVMYNQNCSESITCMSLMEANNAYHVIVCDNSTIPTTNKEFCLKHNWEYISMGGNLGLSIAYNQAIKSIEKEDCWIILFDQDTKVTNDYFNKMADSIRKYGNIPLHIPKVVDEKGLLSPAYIQKYSVSRLKKDCNDYAIKNITAINTGMVIKKEVFNIVGYYDERYFLDYVDHQFMRSFKKKYHEVKVFDAVIYQKFSDNTHDDLNSDLARFKIYCKDFGIFCSDSVYGRIYYVAKTVFRAVKLSTMYKDMEFIKFILKREI